jgi:peptide/nickel transport system substrate-binding protein
MRSKSVSKICLWGQVLIILALLLTSCSTSQTAQPVPTASTSPQGQQPAAPAASEQAPATQLNRDPKTLVFPMIGFAGDFDPASCGSESDVMILFGTTEGLIRAKPDNPTEYDPQLAESWEYNDEKTVLTLHIRKNATFHDGTPVDAEAVKFSLTRLINSKLGFSFDLAQIVPDPDTQFVVTDPYTMEIRLTAPNIRLLPALSSNFGPYIISPKAVKDHEQNGDLAHEWLKTNEAGSGPYMLTESVPNDHYLLTRYDGWWGWDDKWHFDKILVKVVPEENSRRALMETGDADIATEFGPEAWDAFKKNPDLHPYLTPQLAIELIYLGVYGPLEDPRVRQAFAYAFDYDGYINGYWKGLAPSSKGQFPQKLECADPNVFTFKTDLTKAKQLLDEAGFDYSQPIRYISDTGLHMPAGLILQSQLAKIGVNLKIENRENYLAGMFYSDAQWPERPETFGWTTWPNYNDPTTFSWGQFHTDAWGSKGQNATFYSNPRVDEIINTAMTVTDSAQYCEMYKELQDIVNQQDPYAIAIMDPPDDTVLRSDIGGYVPSPVYRFIYDFSKFYRVGY